MSAAPHNQCVDRMCRPAADPRGVDRDGMEPLRPIRRDRAVAASARVVDMAATPDRAGASTAADPASPVAPEPARVAIPEAPLANRARAAAYRVETGDTGGAGGTVAEDCCPSRSCGLSFVVVDVVDSKGNSMKSGSGSSDRSGVEAVVCHGGNAMRRIERCLPACSDGPSSSGADCPSSKRDSYGSAALPSSAGSIASASDSTGRNSDSSDSAVRSSNSATRLIRLMGRRTRRLPSGNSPSSASGWGSCI